MKRFALFFIAFAACASTGIEPPVAKRDPHMETWHGQQRVDDYFWMRKKGTPEVESYLAAENAYTDRMMKPTEALQKKLYDEMLARIKQTDLSVPYRKRGYFYYSRTEEGKQYPIQCRKKGSLDAPEEILLDLNAMGQKFVSLGTMSVSDDGNLLAYSLDTTGFRDFTLYIKDLRTGTLAPEQMQKVKSVAWAKDSKTLFYTTDDAAKRPYRCGATR